MPGATLKWLPLTLANWLDFERLLGTRGACGGCWCMAWRLQRADWNRGKGDANRLAMRNIVAQGRSPGILLYRGGLPVGWCSIAPREEFVALTRSKVWKPVDERPVWSVSCFFVARDHRNQGLSVELLRAAIEFARGHGAQAVEGYPQEITGQHLPAAFVWTGLAAAFRQAGFREVARRSATKPVMRFEIERG